MRVLDAFSIMLSCQPKHTSMNAYCDMLRRQWINYGKWGCPIEHTLQAKALDERVMQRTWLEYTKFKLKITSTCKHGVPTDQLFPGPVRCPACRYEVTNLTYDMNMKLIQLAAASKREHPWEVRFHIMHAHAAESRPLKAVTVHEFLDIFLEVVQSKLD